MWRSPRRRHTRRRPHVLRVGSLPSHARLRRIVVYARVVVAKEGGAQPQAVRLGPAPRRGVRHGDRTTALRAKVPIRPRAAALALLRGSLVDRKRLPLREIRCGQRHAPPGAKGGARRPATAPAVTVHGLEGRDVDVQHHRPAGAGGGPRTRRRHSARRRDRRRGSDHDRYALHLFLLWAADGVGAADWQRTFAQRKVLLPG